MNFLSLSAAVIGFEERVYNGSESEGEIQVVVAVLQGELSAPVRVRLSTMDGSALSPTDYQSLNQTLTFSPNNTRVLITVPITNDGIDEDTESFLGRLSLEPEDEENKEVHIEPDVASLLIIDDDG